MTDRPRLMSGAERRVLVLAVPDLLDTTIALRADGHDDRPHFLSVAGAVEGAAECTSCGEFGLAAAAQHVAARQRPTHLLVRDGSGTADDLERCRSFLEGALAGAASSIRCVIQTHPRPRTSSSSRYDAWLKRDTTVRGDRSLDIVWHEPLTATFPDCRGELQRADVQLAWQHVTGPARTIARRLRDSAPHNLEYTATRMT